MPRIAGVNIPENKQILIALTYVYGIGLALSSKALKQAEIEGSVLASKLNPAQVNNLRGIIEKYKVEGELKREIMMNVKRLKDVGSWRGLRHIKGLPVRGQNTRINSRTVRGNVRKTVGSGKRAAPTAK